MNDWYALVLVAVGLYIVECFAWIDAVAVACLRSPLRRNWTCATGATFVGNERGGLALLAPLNLRGCLIVCHSWPFSVSPQGLTNVTLDRPDAPVAEPAFVAFEDVRSIRAELGELRVNGRRFARIGSAVLGDQVVTQLQRIAACPASERAAAIKTAVSETLNRDAAARQYATFQQKVRRLHAWCSSLFLYTFFVCPGLLVIIGPHPSWRFLLGGWLTLTAITACIYTRVHAAMYPRLRADRWIHALSMIAVPVAAIRCIDKLSRDVLCAFNPAVVAPLVCGVSSATTLIRQQLVDIRAGVQTGDQEPNAEAATDCAQWFRELLAAEIYATLGSLSVAVLAPPGRDGDGMEFYCPRCHAQFGPDAYETCPGCPCSHLVPFGSNRVPVIPGF